MKKDAKILIACEESGVVCKAFRDRGFTNVFSCDLLPTSGGYPEWHIQGDVLEQLDKEWDMIIAHPPCTYLSNAGARHLYPKGILNKERLNKGFEAKKLFMALLNSNIPRICVENPLPSKIYELPKHSQVIQPYMFGHPFKKRTQLWLKNLPLLKPTDIVEVKESTKIPGNWFNKGGKDRQKNRSKTFQGIANAMAEQWGKIK